MTARRFLRALLVLAALAAPAAPLRAQDAPPDPAAGERIERFQAMLRVREDGVIEVEEEIVAVFPEPRHGIYRDIPVRYSDRYGNRQTIRLTVVDVTDGDGEAVPRTISRQGDDLRIKIGDPDRTVTGRRTYRVRYLVRRALLFFPDHDELYWNVTTDRWTLPIARTGATVELPAGIAADAVTTACYTGPTGSTEHECAIGASGATFVFSAREPLTVAVGWPKGFVPEPTRWERARDFLLDNLGVAVPFLVLVALLWTWWTRGRDPRTGTIMAEYEPPDRMRPAEVDGLKDEGVGDEAVAATLVDLAVRGYLVIVEQKEGLLFKSRTYSFRRTAKREGDLTALERPFLDALFHDREEASLKDLREDKEFQKALRAFKSGVLDDLTDRGYFARNPEKVRGAYIAAGIVVAGLAVFFSETIQAWFGTASFVGLLVSGGLIMVFGKVMPRRLPKGAKAFWQAKGFRLYLSQAEKHRLAWQEKERIFETFLPYAMVFGVVGAWVAAMKTLAMAAPAWYVGADMRGGFDLESFGNAIGSFSSTAARGIAPSSSGSGGGGSSGGGFGGGGGGSW